MVMKLAVSLVLFLTFLGVSDASTSSNWIDLELQDGTRVNGFVANVTDKTIHVVSSSLNHQLPIAQLNAASRTLVKERYPLPPTEASSSTTTVTTADALKASLQRQRQQLYQQVADIYSPHYGRYAEKIPFSPYYRSYYLPSGYSLSYPVYHHNYHPLYAFPRWTIKIDL